MSLRPSRTRALLLIFWLACSESWGMGTPEGVAPRDAGSGPDALSAPGR